MKQKKYGFWNAAFDITMLMLTGGFWLLYVIVRFLRTR